MQVAAYLLESRLWPK